MYFRFSRQSRVDSPSRADARASAVHALSAKASDDLHESDHEYSYQGGAGGGIVGAAFTDTHQYSNSIALVDHGPSSASDLNQRQQSVFRAHLGAWLFGRHGWQVRRELLP